NNALARADSWFNSMRSADGYGGPVAHWWQQSLMYTGPGLDWRYEGIIHSYVNLWTRTGNDHWLNKAIRAADDLIAGQSDDGHFRASAFEMNPSSGGTPHEAACDIGLLLVAAELKSAGDLRWAAYSDCAQRNLERFALGQLWDPDTQSIGDSTSSEAFVPNKAATWSEAFFLLSEVVENPEWAERYAIPTLRRVMNHQIQGRGDLDGAIAQNSLGNKRVEKYFPVYIARCVSGLLQGYKWTNQEQYLDSALRAMRFVARWLSEDGSLLTVVYANRRASATPSWIAPLGDVLRAAEELTPFGFDADFRAVARRLMAGQDESGGFQTGRGFASQAFGSATDVPDVRDLLHVAGWCDKSFRYLSAHAGRDLPPQTPSRATFMSPCAFRGIRLQFIETAEMIEISDYRRVVYRWLKGDPWPEIATPEFWLR
ncbi:MAG: hypothetical protein WD401_05425, partial [Thermomicrobiaceae bacterium]